MRKRIQKLAMGKFEHEQPVLAISVDKIEATVLEGHNLSGEFTITSTNGKKMKGLVYSSNPYMECLTSQFVGEEVHIKYEFHSEGFIEGDIQKGEFSIICNQVEYNLSFVVSIIRLYAETSIGSVKNLTDFTQLAMNNFSEAYRLFGSSAFSALFHEDDSTARLFYEGFSMQPTMLNLEEFLVSIHKKEPLRFSVEDGIREFKDVRENQQESLSLRKNNWGYLEIEVESRDDFLIPMKICLTSEDFVGNFAELPYQIDASGLHKGINYGKIVLQNAYQMEEVVIRVSQDQGDLVTTTNTWDKQTNLKELAQFYLDYRMKKIGGALWASKTIEILSHLQALEDDVWYNLMKVQAYTVSRQRQEAEWILDEYKKSSPDKESPQYGYYLYLCSLQEREPAYVGKLAKEIEQIYRLNQDSDILFWVLLYMKEEYCVNSDARLQALRRRIQDGCKSPYLYMEAFYIFWQNPHLLVKLEDFEILILHWACRHGMLTEELGMSVARMTGLVKTYNPLFYQLLVSLFEKYDRLELLNALCSYLVRTQRFSPKYHTWYEQGIQESLRITGLNEAYLMSMDETNITTMPRVVQLYFQYNPTVPYKKKAALLVNIIAGREKEPIVYQNYRKILEEFAYEQLQQGHIDDNLAIIYGDVMDKGMIDKTVVSSMAKIMYTNKMTVFAEMNKVYVIHRQLKEIQVVPIVHHTAYFQLYSRDYVIVLEDAYGKKYSAGISYQLERLMNPGTYLRKCLRFAPHETAFLLQYFAGREKSLMFMPDDREYLLQLVESDRLRDSYLYELFPEVIRYLERMDEMELLHNYLVKIPLEKCGREDRVYLMEQLIEQREYERAFQAIQQYGVANMNPSTLATLCTYQIQQYEMEEDDFLINLSAYTFLHGKYSDVILQYLEKYYCGPTANLKKLWKACYAFELDSFELEERLLVQMLYSTEFVDGVEEVYESYCKHGGKELVRSAYMSYFSYIYLVKNMLIPLQVFPEILQWISDGRKVPDVCKIALLCYFTEENDWNDIKMDVAFPLVEEYVERNMYFAFYRNLPERIKEHFQFYDKNFLEFRANPEFRVRLHYRREQEQEFAVEEMNDVYEGIFVKTFTLFFEESVEYFITEDDGSKSRIVESGVLLNKDVSRMRGQNRFELLNAILIEQALGNEKERESFMVSYGRRELMNEKLFRML